MSNKLVSTSEVLAFYRKKNFITLKRWMSRDKNPLPKPVAGGRGKGNQYLWRLDQLQSWEIKEYGAVISDPTTH